MTDLNGFKYQFEDDRVYPAQAENLSLSTQAEGCWKWAVILSVRRWRESEGSLAFHLTLCWCRPLGKWPREDAEFNCTTDMTRNTAAIIISCSFSCVAGPQISSAAAWRHQNWIRIRRVWLNSEAFWSFLKVDKSLLVLISADHDLRNCFNLWRSHHTMVTEKMEQQSASGQHRWERNSSHL